jgi:hypothetical protein
LLIAILARNPFNLAHIFMQLGARAEDFIAEWGISISTEENLSVYKKAK